MRFSAFLVFAALWSILVYAVLAHWSFGGGWMFERGTLDFAGGVPVEMVSAGLRSRRRACGRRAQGLRPPGPAPHNAVYVLVGAGLLWFGWFRLRRRKRHRRQRRRGRVSFVNTLLTPACALITCSSRSTRSPAAR